MRTSSDCLEFEIAATIDIDTGICYHGERDYLRHMGYTYAFLEDFGAMVLEHFGFDREWLNKDAANGLPIADWVNVGSAPPTAECGPLTSQSMRRAYLKVSIQKDYLYNLPNQLYRMLNDADHSSAQVNILGFPVTITAATPVFEPQIPEGRLGQKLIDGDLPYIGVHLRRRGLYAAPRISSPAP